MLSHSVRYVIMILKIERLIRTIPQTDEILGCEFACFDWANITEDCASRYADSYDMVVCMCQDSANFQKNLEACNACVQTLDKSDPKVVKLQNLLQAYQDAQVCEMLNPALSNPPISKASSAPETNFEPVPVASAAVDNSKSIKGISSFDQCF